MIAPRVRTLVGEFVSIRDEWTDRYLRHDHLASLAASVKAIEVEMALLHRAVKAAFSEGDRELRAAALYWIIEELHRDLRRYMRKKAAPLTRDQALSWLRSAFAAHQVTEELEQALEAAHADSGAVPIGIKRNRR